jgi:hypothetical protein
MRLDTLAINETTLLGDLRLPELPVDLLRSLGVEIPAPGQANNRNTTRQADTRQTNNQGNTAASGFDEYDLGDGSDALPEASAGGGTSLPEYGLELPSYNPLLD